MAAPVTLRKAKGVAFRSANVAGIALVQGHPFTIAGAAERRDSPGRSVRTFAERKATIKQVRVRVKLTCVRH
jgi:hypothetical protein